jgi:hypothetical protein
VKVRNNLKDTPLVDHIVSLRKLPEPVYNKEKYLERSKLVIETGNHEKVNNKNVSISLIIP